MAKLGDFLFPKNPKRVQERKLRLLFFTIFLCVLSCALVGLLFYFLNQHPMH
jgi:hypothetical protein